MSNTRRKKEQRRKMILPLKTNKPLPMAWQQVTLICSVPCPGSRCDSSSGDSHSQGPSQCITSTKIDCIFRSDWEEDAGCDIGAGGIKYGASSPGMAAWSSQPELSAKISREPYNADFKIIILSVRLHHSWRHKAVHTSQTFCFT